MHFKYALRRSTIIILVMIILASCTPDNAKQDLSIQEFNFSTEDDIRLSCTLYTPKNGEIAVVLAHQGTTGTDQRSWQPFAEYIAEKGFVALTFDFRGRGDSEGELQVNLLERDVRAAVDYLQDHRYSQLVCMGASMGGTACMKVVLETDLEGLVVIASSPSLGNPTQIKPEDYALLTMPKLYISAEDDTVDGTPTNIPATISLMHKVSPEPKGLRFFPGEAHGTELFDKENGEEFRALLLNFLEGLR